MLACRRQQSDNSICDDGQSRPRERAQLFHLRCHPSGQPDSRDGPDGSMHHVPVPPKRYAIPVAIGICDLVRTIARARYGFFRRTKTTRSSTGTGNRYKPTHDPERVRQRGLASRCLMCDVVKAVVVTRRPPGTTAAVQRITLREQAFRPALTMDLSAVTGGRHTQASQSLSEGSDSATALLSASESTLTR
jgi:hypothetical protein